MEPTAQGRGGAEAEARTNPGRSEERPRCTHPGRRTPDAGGRQSRAAPGKRALAVRAARAVPWARRPSPEVTLLNEKPAWASLTGA